MKRTLGNHTSKIRQRTEIANRLVIISAVLAVLLSSCKHNPVDAPLKNPREYSWTIDTIAYPGSSQTLMSCIWGSSASDLYVGGHNERGFGEMYHFDGQKWQPVTLTLGAIEMSEIFGFGSMNVWGVGNITFANSNPPPNVLDSSLVIHYDGKTWQGLTFVRQRELVSIWGSSPNNIWMGGVNGSLFHYDGAGLIKDSVPMYIPKNADPFYSFYSITGSSTTDAYMLLYAPHQGTGGERYYTFHHQPSGWTLIDSTFSVYTRKIWMSPPGSLFAIGGGVFKKTSSSWQSLQMDALTSLGIAGMSDEDFFVVGMSGAGGTFGEVYHYNGSDWFQFKSLELQNVEFMGIWTDGREAFVVGWSFGSVQTTIILHGK
jgi:hypothetical protein